VECSCATLLLRQTLRQAIGSPAAIKVSRLADKGS
jgi:hypothetical protein